MKERFVLASLLLMTGNQIRQTEVIPSCPEGQALVVETPWPKGVTLPLSLDGKTSIILVNNRKNKPLVEHELGHAEQICEEGLGFLVNYSKNPARYEQDADLRAWKRRNP